MEIRDLQPNDLDPFLAFYASCFAQRSNAVSLFNHEFRNPCGEDRCVPIVLLALDKESIVGQLLIQQCKYVCNGRVTPCYIGYDFYVREGHRRSGPGGMLAFDAIRRFCPYFAFGPSEMAKRILLALDMQPIGELHKYLWLRKSPAAVISIARGLTGALNPWMGRPFPDALATADQALRQSFDPLNGNDADMNGGVLFFTRDPEFINWRFLDHPNRYSLFTYEFSPSTFFVVRMCHWRGLRLVSLVDYRFPIGRPEFFECIVDAAKRLAKIVSADGVLTMSSYALMDQILRRSGFLKIGKPKLIMADLQSNLEPERISAREAVLVTMADGDTDLLFRAVDS